MRFFDMYAVAKATSNVNKRRAVSLKWPLIIVGIIFSIMVLLGLLTNTPLLYSVVFAGCLFAYCPMLGAEGNGMLRNLIDKFEDQIKQDIIPQTPWVKMIFYTVMAGMPFYGFWELTAIIFYLPSGFLGWLALGAPIAAVSLVRLNRTKIYWKELCGKPWMFWGLQLLIYLLMLGVTGLFYWL